MAAVVVDYDAAETAAACVSSLLAEQVAEVLVVEANGDPAHAAPLERPWPPTG